MMEALFDYVKNDTLPELLSLILNNSFLAGYFCYILAIILTTFALNLITNCAKENKISNMIMIFGTKIAIYILLTILTDILKNKKL